MSLPLRVLLAGHNLDVDTLRELRESAEDGSLPPNPEAITPETLSAAYARISRYPEPVPELRKKARMEVEKARKSNDKIIFGLGHSSVAEHATFNLDILGISRLAVEAVEHHRLASFTEKSQRYIKLDGDYVVAPEIEEAGDSEHFNKLIETQNRAYFALYPKLFDYFREIHAQRGYKNPDYTAKGNASEDARYVVSLATQTQLGMTVNARTTEIMIRRTAAHPLAEVREFGAQLCEAVKTLAPSLVKYTDPTDYERSLHDHTNLSAESEPSPDNKTISTSPDNAVRLLHYNSCGEELIVASLLMRESGREWQTCMEKVIRMDENQRREIIRKALINNEPWDPAPREFELAEFVYEITLSSTAFAQLKRHRMATILPGRYNTALKFTIPPSILAIKEENLFKDIMEESSQFANHVAQYSGAASQYALTNAHRRKVVFRANARELQHISRLREDIHAQWDIRSIAQQMIQITRDKCPALLMLAAGKHAFEKCKISL